MAAKTKAGEVEEDDVGQKAVVDRAVGRALKKEEKQRRH